MELVKREDLINTIYEGCVERFQDEEDFEEIKLHIPFLLDATYSYKGAMESCRLSYGLAMNFNMGDMIWVLTRGRACDDDQRIQQDFAVIHISDGFNMRMEVGEKDYHGWFLLDKKFRNNVFTYLGREGFGLGEGIFYGTLKDLFHQINLPRQYKGPADNVVGIDYGSVNADLVERVVDGIEKVLKTYSGVNI